MAVLNRAAAGTASMSLKSRHQCMCMMADQTRVQWFVAGFPAVLLSAATVRSQSTTSRLRSCSQMTSARNLAHISQKRLVERGGDREIGHLIGFRFANSTDMTIFANPIRESWSSRRVHSRQCSFTLNELYKIPPECRGASGPSQTYTYLVALRQFSVDSSSTDAKYFHSLWLPMALPRSCLALNSCRKECEVFIENNSI